MIIKVKKYEELCLAYAQRFIKDWATYCVVKDAYLKGRADTLERLHKLDRDHHPKAMFHAEAFEEVKLEVTDHQIGSKSTDNAGE